MNKANPVWISSYPRSGNTLLRTIIWQCFGYQSGSVYLDDLDGNKDLGNHIGHIERGPDQTLRFPENTIPFIKTHELASDDNPAIYVVRDGRAVCVSLWRFYNDYFSLEEIIDGNRHKFGTWAAHVQSWNPFERPNTLLLRYEDMTNDLSQVLKSISAFLNCEIIKDSIPDRNSIAEVAGKFVKKSSDWRSELSGDLLDKFMQINGEMLEKTEYLD